MNNWKSILMTNCCFFFFWMSNDFILGNNIMLLFFTLTYMYSVYFLLPLGTWTPFNPETVRLMIGKNHTLWSTLHTFLAKALKGCDNRQVFMFLLIGMITASCKEIVEVELDDKVLGKKGKWNWKIRQDLLLRFSCFLELQAFNCLKVICSITDVLSFGCWCQTISTQF